VIYLDEHSMRLKFGKIKRVLQNVAGIAERDVMANCTSGKFGIN
jgi:hypothetical protein